MADPKPSTNIPNIDAELARQLVQRLYGLKVVDVKALNSYDDKNFHIQVNTDFSAMDPDDRCRHGYVLKVLNSLDSKSSGYVDAQNKMMIYLRKQGVDCPIPIKNLKGELIHLERLGNHLGSDSEQNSHVLRLLTYVTGDLLVSVDYTPTVLVQVGQFAASIDQKLLNFEHEALGHHDKIWNLSALPRLKEFVYAVEDEQRRNLASEVITAFEQEVIPQYPNLSKGPIHGDMNEQNILVTRSEDGSVSVTGMIDFGDIQHSYHLFELAILNCYMMIDCKTMDAIQAPGHVLAGYTKLRKIPQQEWDLLKVCIAARFCQSLVLGAFFYTQTKDEYVLTTQKRGWACLEALWKTPNEELHVLWENIMQAYLAK